MSNVICRVVFLVLASFQIPTWALDDFPQPNQPKQSVYLGLGYDTLNIKTNRSGFLAQYPTLSANTTIESSSPNMSLVAGGRFDEHLAMQFDFIFYGSIRTKDSGVSKKLLSPQMWSVSAILSQPVTDGINVFGKLGGNHWSLDDANNAENTVNEGFGLMYGAGIDFNLYGGKDRMLRLEWTHYQMDGVFLDTADGITFGALFNIP